MIIIVAFLIRLLINESFITRLGPKTRPNVFNYLITFSLFNCRMTFLVNKRNSFKFLLKKEALKTPECVFQKSLYNNGVKNGWIFILIFLGIMCLHMFFFLLVKKYFVFWRKSYFHFQNILEKFLKNLTFVFGESFFSNRLLALHYFDWVKRRRK